MTIEQTPAVNLIDAFAHYARGAGAIVEVAGPDQAAAWIAQWRQGALKYTAAVGARYPALVRALDAPIAVAEEVAATGLDRAALGAALAGGTGLILAHAGVAETGSLVLADQGLAPRLVSMLTDVCVALLPVGAIVPDLDAAGRLLADLEARGHRYLSLVTGPSRSGDIELSLTIGVHGPKALYILLLREET
jgi:L-lactate dehydrogenase complex protein LldG